jgi:DNA-binding response OmpR family regulator
MSSVAPRAMRVLVIEPDPEILDLLVPTLQRLQLVVRACASFVQARECINQEEFKLLLAYEWCLNKNPHELAFLESLNFPILILSSAITRVEKQAQGLCYRAPSEPSTFEESIRSVCDLIPLSAHCISDGDVVLDSKTFDVYISGQRTHLTPHEFSLLEALMRNKELVLTRECLIQKVQGAGIVVVDRAIDTHVSSLRKKLGTAGERLETVRGEGYRFRGVRQ